MYEVLLQRRIVVPSAQHPEDTPAKGAQDQRSTLKEDKKSRNSVREAVYEKIIIAP